MQGKRLLLRGALAIAPAAAVLTVALAACGGADDPPVAALEDGERFPGGAATNTLLLGSNAFTPPVANVTDANAPLFFAGNGFFNQPWVEAPSSTDARDGLGPLFHARSCSACHFKDGRGRPPLEAGEPFVGLLLRLSVPGEGPHGEPVPEPTYGAQLQPFANPGVPAEGFPTVTYEELPGTYADGEPYALLAPTYAIDALAYGPLAEGAKVSPRVAPAVIGVGLLQAIPDARLEALADPDDRDGDGISGRVQRVWDPARGALVVGRFGWKAEQPSARAQAAAAFRGDLGITSSLAPTQDCTVAEPECLAAPEGGAPEIDDALLDRVDVYSRLLAVPVRERFDDRVVLRGKRLFAEAGCAACHVPSHRTAADADLPELRDQLVWPYTDLLLHDLGEGLADGRPVLAASGREWRTPPLWGLRFVPIVNGHDRLLHDGRARGVAEAILWHGGEAERAREHFRNLPRDDRAALVQFVESL